jgi:hypothetical protein
VTGNAKIMTYDDIVRAEEKRAAKVSAKGAKVSAKGAKRGGRRPQGSKPGEGSSPHKRAQWAGP